MRFIYSMVACLFCLSFSEVCAVSKDSQTMLYQVGMSETLAKLVKTIPTVYDCEVRLSVSDETLKPESIQLNVQVDEEKLRAKYAALKQKGCAKLEVLPVDVTEQEIELSLESMKKLISHMVPRFFSKLKGEAIEIRIELI